MFTKSLVCTLIDILALVQRGCEPVARWTATLVRSGQVHALRETTAWSAVQCTLVDIAT